MRIDGKLSRVLHNVSDSESRAVGISEPVATTPTPVKG
jgi:hypothetical protein